MFQLRWVCASFAFVMCRFLALEDLTASEDGAPRPAVLQKSDDEAVKRIRERLKSPDRKVRSAAVLALGKHVTQPGVIEDIESMLSDEDPDVSVAAASSLGAGGTDSAAAIPALILKLHHKNPVISMAAATALVRVGPSSEQVIGALTSLAKNGIRSQRIRALRALENVNPSTKSDVDVVLAATTDADAGVRRAARDSLRRLSPDLSERQFGRPFDPLVASQQDRTSMQVGPGDWPMWGGSRLRNNTQSAKNVPTDWDVACKLNIKWRSKLGSQTYGNPSVANGKVFIGTNNGNGYLARYPARIDLGVMLCFNESNGEFLWQYSSPKLPTGRVHDWPQQGMPSTPLVDGNRVWAVTNRCEVVCLDTEGFRDGENDGPYRSEANEHLDEADIVWRLDMVKELGVSPHNMSTCSVLAADGRLFVCTSNGVDEGHIRIPAPDAPSFLALDRETGAVLWTDHSPGENILHGQWASPSYAVLGGQPQVIFSGGDGWLYSFDPKGDGHGASKLLWKFDCNTKDSKYVLGGRSTRNFVIGFVCIYDDLVYVAPGEDPEHGEGVGHLWCLDPTQKFDGSDISADLVVDQYGNIVPHRRICAVEPDLGERVIPNPESAVVWKFSHFDRNANGKKDFNETFHRCIGSPVIKDDILYIADMAGLLHCIDAKTGVSYWSYDLFSACWGSPLIVDEKIYVGDEDGVIKVFNHSSNPAIAMPMGNPVAEIEMIDSIYSTPIVANNVLYIATKNMLYAIECEGEKSGSP